MSNLENQARKDPKIDGTKKTEDVFKPFFSKFWHESELNPFWDQLLNTFERVIWVSVSLKHQFYLHSA